MQVTIVLSDADVASALKGAGGAATSVGSLLLRMADNALGGVAELPADFLPLAGRVADMCDELHLHNAAAWLRKQGAAPPRPHLRTVPAEPDPVAAPGDVHPELVVASPGTVVLVPGLPPRRWSGPPYACWDEVVALDPRGGTLPDLSWATVKPGTPEPEPAA